MRRKTAKPLYESDKRNQQIVNLKDVLIWGAILQDQNILVGFSKGFDHRINEIFTFLAIYSHRIGFVFSIREPQDNELLTI